MCACACVMSGPQAAEGEGADESKATMTHKGVGDVAIAFEERAGGGGGEAEQRE